MLEVLSDVFSKSNSSIKAAYAGTSGVISVLPSFPDRSGASSKQPMYLTTSTNITEEEILVGNVPLKRLEIAIHKLLDLAIPRHTGILEKHRNNIEKYARSNDLSALNKERINSRLTVQQLKADLRDIEVLLGQCREEDAAELLARVIPVKDHVLDTLTSFLKLAGHATILRGSPILKQSPKKLSGHQNVETKSGLNPPSTDTKDVKQIHLVPIQILQCQEGIESKHENQQEYLSVLQQENSKPQSYELSKIMHQETMERQVEAKLLNTPLQQQQSTMDLQWQSEMEFPKQKVTALEKKMIDDLEKRVETLEQELALLTPPDNSSTVNEEKHSQAEQRDEDVARL